MDLQPLSKEEIDEMENIFQFSSVRWQRLFYSARLGAEFERVCTKDGTGEKPLDTEAREV